MKSFNIHAGHNPDGKKACGAIGLIKESTEARKVKDDVIALLKKEGKVAHDCTVENGASASDVINKIINLTKRNKVDLDVSIHFNSGRADKKGDGKTGGVEVLVYKLGGVAEKKAKAVCEAVSKSLGLNNRGVKVRTDLGVLKRTTAPCILIECCFVDDYDDCKAYNHKAMAKAIVEGLVGKSISSTTSSNTNISTQGSNTSRKYANGGYDRKAKVVGTNGTGLNVRKERGVTNDTPVKNLAEGTVITVSYCLDNWFSTYDVKHNGKPCYVSGAYIELI